MLGEEAAFWFTIALFVIAGIGWAMQGFWKFVQVAICTAVIASNIAWHWTPNMYLPTIVGIAAAYLLTVLVFKLETGLSHKSRTSEVLPRDEIA